jgi:hypothetical protein
MTSRNVHLYKVGQKTHQRRIPLISWTVRPYKVGQWTEDSSAPDSADRRLQTNVDVMGKPESACLGQGISLRSALMNATASFAIGEMAYGSVWYRLEVKVSSNVQSKLLRDLRCSNFKIKISTKSYHKSVSASRVFLTSFTEIPAVCT